MKTTIKNALTVFGMSAMLTGNVYAQFQKYKSKSDFSKKKDDAKQIVVKPSSADATKKDIFGRSANDSKAPGAKKKKEYVILNPETAFGPEVVTSFDFPNTSLKDLTMHMQKITGINLIMDKDLKGKVSIMAPSAITVGDAWKAYLTALNMNGYSLVKSGAFYKVVSAREIRYTPTKIYTGNYTPRTENYVMRIIPLKNINSTEVTRSFRPFMSRYGRILDIKQTNTIIVQDTGTNINRLMRLIKFIDVPGHEESLQIIQVNYSSAQEIAKLLGDILKGSSSKLRSRKKDSNISKIIAEPRTNSIIAMANADGAKQLRSLITKLDVRSASTGSGQIHVYYLNYGEAKKVGETLKKLVTDASSKTKSRFSKTASATSLFTNPVKVSVDEQNNALVVIASPTDYLTIKNVINKLDIPRDQVYVEGLIMETQVNRRNSFGISLVGAYGNGSAKKAGFTGDQGSDLVNLLTNNITSLGGLFIGGGIGKTVTQDLGNGQTAEINTVTGLITAIAINSNTNVLATPQILALDNEEAAFEVGETVPIEVKTIANSTTSISNSTQKITLTLKIKPQINKVTRYVKLKINQKVDDFSGRQLSTQNGFATTTRSADTTVVIRDKDTIAMGGLMRDKESETINKVPLLGDIPVLGWLFKQKNKTVEKVNLLFFLTPKIMATYEKEVPANTKDLLNRRSSHLKNAFGENDPFGTTVKGLYDKAKQQEKGPLYDPASVEKFKSNNRQNQGIDGGDQASNSSPYQAPDYSHIIQKVKTKKSAVKK